MGVLVAPLGVSQRRQRIAALRQKGQSVAAELVGWAGYDELRGYDVLVRRAAAELIGYYGRCGAGRLPPAGGEYVAHVVCYSPKS